MSARYHILVSLSALVCVPLLACGGNGGDTVDTDVFANNVCSAVTEWLGAVTAPFAQFQTLDPATADPAGLKADLVASLDNAVEATENLLDTLRDAGQPDVDGADETVQALRDGVEATQKTFEDARDAVEDLPEESASLAAGLQTVAADLQAGLDELGQSVEEAQGSEELSAAFEEATECNDLAEG